jgi:hypothetical protein
VVVLLVALRCKRWVEVVHLKNLEERASYRFLAT